MTPRKSLADRFWEKVAVAGPDECWEWRGCRQPNGYGKLGSPDGRTLLAHRASYFLAHGSIDPKLVVLHACDNRQCVNPGHLAQGTTRENVADMIAKGRSGRQRQSHCKSGHPFTPENTYRQSNGSRGCRQCKRRWGREAKLRAKTRSVAA